MQFNELNNKERKYICGQQRLDIPHVAGTQRCDSVVPVLRF